MTIRKIFTVLLCATTSGVAVNGQDFILKGQSLDNKDNEPLPVFPVPHDRQVKWMETEFYAFFHYGMNTYTDKEWGYGNEDEATFAPTAAPNPKQWLQAAQAAGMKGGIAVVKHHDGFCLWPTATTSHCVTNAGNDYGRATNIPQDFSAAAKELGMKYGFYISPWDRNSAYYGTDSYVKDVFLRQCDELTKYGENQFEMWFDGANGGSGYYGGKNTTVSVTRETYYDVPNLRDTVHKTQPDCVMWGVGGEARWIGNEDGYAATTNWCTDNRDQYSISDLESHGTTGEEDGWFWLPGESDAMATDKGWFWHEGESMKSAERLYQMYLETVGRNSTLILNCPPNKAGVLPEEDVSTLKELGDLITSRLGTDLAKTATLTASDERTEGASRSYAVNNLTDDDTDTYWATNDGTTSATITLMWDSVQTIHYVALQEYIRKGQRIKDFTIQVSIDGNTWNDAEVESGTDVTTTIGYKRIIPLNGSTTSYGSGYQLQGVRIQINDSKACPLLHTISVY